MIETVTFVEPGWLPDARHAMLFLAAWVVVVLFYAIWRSRGEARPDPIRPSGPGV